MFLLQNASTSSFRSASVVARGFGVVLVCAPNAKPRARNFVVAGAAAGFAAASLSTAFLGCSRDALGCLAPLRPLDSAAKQDCRANCPNCARTGPGQRHLSCTSALGSGAMHSAPRALSPPSPSAQTTKSRTNRSNKCVMAAWQSWATDRVMVSPAADVHRTRRELRAPTSAAACSAAAGSAPANPSADMMEW